MVSMIHQHDDVITRHTDREGTPLVCTASDDSSVYIQSMIIRNRPPNDPTKLYALLEQTNFFSSPPEDYDEWHLIRPAEEWWLAYCKNFTGEQLRNEKFREINNDLKDYLVALQSTRETHIEILDVKVAQPKLSPTVEQNLAAIAEHTSAYRAAQGRQKLELLERETENKKKMQGTELLNKQKVASAESRKTTSAIEYQSEIQKETASAKIAKIQYDSESARILAIAEANKLASMMQNDVDAHRVQTVHGGDSRKFVEEVSSKNFLLAMERSNSSMVVGNGIPKILHSHSHPIGTGWGSSLSSVAILLIFVTAVCTSYFIIL